MKNTMRIMRIVITITCHLFLCIKKAYSAELAEHSLESSHNLELKPMFAVHNGQVQHNNLDIVDFYDKYDSLCRDIVQKYDSLLKLVNNNVQRYVSLFLISSGLLEEESGPNEMISVDLVITISSEDLAYLRSFYEMSEHSSSTGKDFSRTLEILSKMARRRERSHAESILRFSVSLFHNLGLAIHNLFLQCNFYRFVPHLTILLVTWLVYHFMPRKKFYIYLGTIVNSMIFWDSLNLYRIKLKEVFGTRSFRIHYEESPYVPACQKNISVYLTEADAEWEALRLQGFPPECDSKKTRWYHSVMSVFYGDRCSEYLKMLRRDPMEEVSLFKCILDTYSFYTVNTVFKVLGASIRDFTGEVSGLWPKSVRWFIQLPLVPFVIVTVGILILILCGKRLRLSFFGASFEIGESTLMQETRIIHKRGPRLISNWRLLKMLGKKKLFRRLEMDLARERRPGAYKPKLPVRYEKKNVAEAYGGEITTQNDGMDGPIELMRTRIKGQNCELSGNGLCPDQSQEK